MIATASRDLGRLSVTTRAPRRTLGVSGNPSPCHPHSTRDPRSLTQITHVDADLFLLLDEWPDSVVDNGLCG